MMIINVKSETVNMPKKKLLLPVSEQLLIPAWNWDKARCKRTVRRADVSKEIPPTWLKVSSIQGEPKETPEPKRSTSPRRQSLVSGSQSKASRPQWTIQSDHNYELKKRPCDDDN